MESSNFPVHFGDWVKRRRKALDLTQNELAQRSSCSTSAVRKIESGERRPSKQLAKLLAVALEIPPEKKSNFLKIARGELNLERLDALAPAASFASISGLQAAVPPSRIPLQPNPLVGREAELSAMERLFDESQCRLLTLTGVGGIGKTRLAVEFASRQRSAFPGGVFYISLAPVNSADAIVPAIADALGFVFSGPTEPKEQLINYMAWQLRQSVLLVLDNLEHLLVQPLGEHKTGAVELVSEFLHYLSNVRILATSRERLNLQGEWTYELHGLPTPSVDYAGELDDYSAVALFLQNARRAKIDFEASGDERTALIKICRLVDGIPLAIELASAWVGMLSCQEIAQEINSNIDFLKTSMWDVPERHRSIRASFDHSWNLLSGEEQRVLCQLSVFRGGFDRNAAEQIAGASLPLLASLGSKSLVHRINSNRYDLHEVIRQYASYHLSDDLWYQETNERHCEYYLAYTQEREKLLKCASQQEAVRQLTDEIDNIQAAWAWAISQNKFARLARVVRSLGWYFEAAGLYHQGIEQLELLEQALRSAPQEDLEWQLGLGLTLVQQALLYFRIGEFQHARVLYEDSIPILRSIGDQPLLADALVFLGIIHHLSGDYERARTLLEESLRLSRACNEKWFEAYAIYNLGYIASLRGMLEEGYEQMLVGLNLWRTLGDPQYIALGLNFLVPTLNQLGRFAEAKTFMRESIALCEQGKNRWGLGTAYRSLGLVSLAEGQYSEAQSHFRESLEIFGEHIVGWNIARSLTDLGDATRLAKDVSEARKIYLKALRVSIDANAIPIAMDVLLGFAHLLEQSGDIDFAYILSNYVIKDTASEQASKDRAERLTAKLTEKLDPQMVKTASQKLAMTNFKEIVKEIFESH